jgi:ribose-phosphate pyrophosphokinase
VALVHDAGAVAGDVRGRFPIVVDDIISTGKTIETAVRALRDAGSQREIRAAATHAVLAPEALERLSEADLERLFFTDTMASSIEEADPRATVVSVAPLLATSVRRMMTRRRMAHYVLHP